MEHLHGQVRQAPVCSQVNDPSNRVNAAVGEPQLIHEPSWTHRCVGIGVGNPQRRKRHDALCRPKQSLPNPGGANLSHGAPAGRFDNVYHAVASSDCLRFQGSIVGASIARYDHVNGNGRQHLAGFIHDGQGACDRVCFVACRYHDNYRGYGRRAVLTLSAARARRFGLRHAHPYP